MIPTKILQDFTTNKNIIFATDSYSEFGYNPTDEITIDKLSIISLQPRVLKRIEEQKNRSRKKGEVFTPSWMCNKMNNLIDNEYLGYDNAFNIENEDNTWTTVSDKIDFSNAKDKTWKDYVLSKRLEITCGEAPYIVSRYDTTTGNIIPITDRIGLLDRKLRVITENVKTLEDWLVYVLKAYESIYAYEFQGDNLLIARINMLLSFEEYLDYYFKDEYSNETKEESINKIINVIVHNVFQMNGIKNVIPFSEVSPDVTDWETNEIVKFCDIK